MGHFDAGTLDGEPVTLQDHGARPGGRLRDGQRRARSRSRRSARATARTSLDLLFNRRLSNGQVHSPKSFFKAASNDAADVQLVLHRQQAHRRCTRRPAADPRPRTSTRACRRSGTGKYEWTRLPAARAATRRASTPSDGTIVNWNRQRRPRLRRPPTTSGAATARPHASTCSNKNLDRLANKKGKWTLASVTSAMNAAATQDVRAIDTVPLLKQAAQGLEGARTRRRSRCSTCWSPGSEHGGSRLDLDLDGKIDDPGAAIMDAAWPKIADAFMQPRARPAARRARLAVLALRPAAERPVQRLVPVLRPRHPRAARDEGASSRSTTATAATATSTACQQRDLGGDRRRRRRARPPPRAPPTRRRGAPTRPRSGSTSPPGLLVDDDALHEPPERDPAGDLVQRAPLSRR